MRRDPILRKTEIYLFSWRSTENSVFSEEFGQENSDGNGNMNLQGREKEDFNIIVTDIGNQKF